MKFNRGKTVEPLTRIGDSNETGTTVRFLADDTIFESLDYEYEVLETIWGSAMVIRIIQAKQVDIKMYGSILTT